MKCSRCGNELSQEEVFCGQCGAPIGQTSSTELTHSHPSGVTNSNADNANTIFDSNPSRPLRSGLLSQSGLRPTPLPSMHNPTSGTGYPPAPGTGTLSQPGQQQMTGFYHDATEAMSVLPSGDEYQPRVPQTPMFLSGPPDTPTSSPYQNQGFSGRLPSSPHQGGSGLLRGMHNTGNQGGSYYGSRTTLNAPSGMPPRTTRSNTPLIIALVCAVLLVFCVIGVVAAFATQNHSTDKTAEVTVTATATKAPTATPTQQPTPSPTPSPTAVVTPPPAAGYAWCAASCNTYGFETQYPVSWPAGAASNATGIQFTNPGAIDQFTSYKVGDPGASDATALATADLQTNFGSKAGYTPPQGINAATIGGETWIQVVAYYQSDLNPAARERVIVYSIIHGGKSYIIEQQAQDDQFDALNGQVYTPMLSTFHFVTPPAA